MIEISAEQLKQGLKMAKLACCVRISHCFWGGRNPFYEITCCRVPAFGRIIKQDSELFFRKGFEISEYNNPQADFHDLHVYTETFILFSYPLFLANDRKIPFISLEEIKEEEEGFSKKTLDQVADETLIKMRLINRYWFDWINITYLNSFNQPEKHKNSLRAIALLLELFLKGVRKSRLPDLLGCSLEEKKKFFQDLEQDLKRSSLF